MPALPHEVEIPYYDNRFKILPKPVFYHTIDGAAGTLQVEVFGPNLSCTFNHTKARDIYHATELGSNLERKTAGYLSVIANTDERIVLTWAESGHGSSSAGEMLDATPFVLPNASWTRRATAVMSLLGIKTGSMFDNPRGRHAEHADRLKGIFSGSHVEVKLATHAVFLLLRQFGITDDVDSVSVQDLMRLKIVRWKTNTRPAFEIHVSRKPCPRCKLFVRRLARLTQITLRLQWHERHGRIEYEKGDNGEKPNEGNAYLQDDTVSVRSETESIATLSAVDDSAGTPATLATDAEILRNRTQDDDLLYTGCSSRSVTPPLVIDLTKESKEPAPHEVVDGDVDKPLPATAEFNEPAWMVSLRRSPRPYCSSVLGSGCTCGTSCSKCVKH